METSNRQTSLIRAEEERGDRERRGEGRRRREEGERRGESRSYDRQPFRGSLL